MKICRSCREPKPLDAFNSNGPNRRRSKCRSCLNAAQRRWREGQGGSLWDEKRWAEQVKRKYNLTKAEYQRIIDEQGGRCGICGRSEKAFTRRLHVDHDHHTGQVRGVLCSRCNSALGMLKDDPQAARAALEYLLATNRSEAPEDVTC